MNLESTIYKKIKDSDVSFNIVDNIVFLNGAVKNYDDWVDIGLKIGDIDGVEGVVNNIKWNNKKTDEKSTKRQEIYDQQKNNQIGTYDIVIIGGGVIGCFIDGRKPPHFQYGSLL